MSTAPAGSGSPISRRTVRTVTHRPPPAESPAKTILEGGIALWIAVGGGSIRYKSVKAADMRRPQLQKGERHQLTCCDDVLERTRPGILWSFATTETFSIAWIGVEHALALTDSSQQKLDL